MPIQRVEKGQPIQLLADDWNRIARVTEQADTALNRYGGGGAGGVLSPGEVYAVCSRDFRVGATVALRGFNGGGPRSILESPGLVLLNADRATGESGEVLAVCTAGANEGKVGRFRASGLAFARCAASAGDGDCLAPDGEDGLAPDSAGGIQAIAVCDQIALVSLGGAPGAAVRQDAAPGMFDTRLVTDASGAVSLLCYNSAAADEAAPAGTMEVNHQPFHIARASFPLPAVAGRLYLVAAFTAPVEDTETGALTPASAALELTAEYESTPEKVCTLIAALHPVPASQDAPARYALDKARPRGMLSVIWTGPAWDLWKDTIATGAV